MAGEKTHKTSEIKVKTSEKKILGKTIIGILSATLLGAAVYGGWQNKEALQNWAGELFASSKQNNELSEQITEMQNRLIELQSNLHSVEYLAQNPDLSSINQRIEDIEHINANTVKSKADVEALMGLLVRMDAAEQKLRDLAEISDEGALLLTAAVLVKDAGERGGEFIYEAEVLSQIAKDNLKVRNEAEKLEKIAVNGVPAIAELQRDFIAAYIEKFPTEKEVVREEAQNWQERITNQLKKIIRIKRADDKSEVLPATLSEEEQAWEIVKDYVISGEIIRAIGIAEKPLNHKLLDDDIFQKWLQEAKVYQQFYESISKITAGGLAVMKVNFLKRN